MIPLKDAAKLIGKTESGLRKLISANQITYFQAGSHGRILFKQEWLDEYIAKYTHTEKERIKRERAKKSQVKRVENIHDGFDLSFIRN